MKKLRYGALAVAASLSLMACEDSSTSSSTDVSAFLAVEEIDSDDCSDATEGTLAFEKSTNTMYACTDGEWVSMVSGSNAEHSCESKMLKDSSGIVVLCDGDTVGTLYNGKDGKDGEDGEDGKQGEKGETGKTGEQGTASEEVDITLIACTDSVMKEHKIHKANTSVGKDTAGAFLIFANHYKCDNIGSSETPDYRWVEVNSMEYLLGEACSFDNEGKIMETKEEVYVCHYADGGEGFWEVAKVEDYCTGENVKTPKKRFESEEVSPAFAQECTFKGTNYVRVSERTEWVTPTGEGPNAFFSANDCVVPASASSGSYNVFMEGYEDAAVYHCEMSTSGEVVWELSSVDELIELAKMDDKYGNLSWRVQLRLNYNFDAEEEPFHYDAKAVVYVEGEPVEKEFVSKNKSSWIETTDYNSYCSYVAVELEAEDNPYDALVRYVCETRDGKTLVSKTGRSWADLSKKTDYCNEIVGTCNANNSGLKCSYRSSKDSASVDYFCSTAGSWSDVNTLCADSDESLLSTDKKLCRIPNTLYEETENVDPYESVVDSNIYVRPADDASYIKASDYCESLYNSDGSEKCKLSTIVLYTFDFMYSCTRNEAAQWTCYAYKASNQIY